MNLDRLTPQQRALLAMQLRPTEGKPIARTSTPGGSLPVIAALDPPAAARSASPWQSTLPSQGAEHAEGKLAMSLFFFGGDGDAPSSDRYRLILEAAKLADEYGFEAVWTPERHFHPFGGLYPNPSVVASALAMVTRRLRIRAGSVVLPLHDPIRVAEEWAVVDNLSRGRVDLAFASGWHVTDFVFDCDAYEQRRERTLAAIEVFQRLWMGEAIERQVPGGQRQSIRVYPRPVQARLTPWITSGGHRATFQQAGRLGANVLTNLLSQSFDQLTENILAYRAHRMAAGHNPLSGVVTLMLHTYVGSNAAAVRDAARAPFRQYLQLFGGLLAKRSGSDTPVVAAADLDELSAFVFERYYNSSSLIGTLDSCGPILKHCLKIGVNEVACLIDFGVDENMVLQGLQSLNALRENFA